MTDFFKGDVEIDAVTGLLSNFGVKKLLSIDSPPFSARVVSCSFDIMLLVCYVFFSELPIVTLLGVCLSFFL